MVPKIGTLIGLVILTTICVSAQQGLTLTVGRLTYSGTYIHQNISVKNETSNVVRDVKVECGFFKNGELIAASSAYVENIITNTSGFVTVLERTDVSPDRAECRIVSVR
jgi:hypothetical protein